MERLLVRLPLLVILTGIASMAMIVPATHAFAIGDMHVARAFLYTCVLCCVLTTLLALATDGMVVRRQARSYLITLVAAFTVIPALMAVPFYEALGTTRFVNAWFEMVSSITTTGATLYEPRRLPDSLHLWRAMAGWLGGLLIWVSAVALIAPMNLGGFEVLSDGGIGEGTSPAAGNQITRVADGSQRLIRFTGRLAPVYAALTLVLWIGLLMAGETPLAAVCRAMSTLSTSGITTGQGGGGGLLSELLIFVFLFFAVSRLTFSSDAGRYGLRPLLKDPEMRMGLFCIIVVPGFLVLRHWVGAYAIEGSMEPEKMLRVLWGAVFTALSFLTTTGFESAEWDTATAWSGLQTPGMVLMGLALIGGGVATTAGGVKLLRIYALYKHGVRELEKLVHASSVGGAGRTARRIRRKGAYVAWVFFMLFALSIALLMVAFSLTGLAFEKSTVLTLAALTTTGPLVTLAAGEPIIMGELSYATRTVFAAAMVLGRMETLALIALLNPDFWRR